VSIKKIDSKRKRKKMGGNEKGKIEKIVLNSKKPDAWNISKKN
jgi:hypothetical protein